MTTNHHLPTVLYHLDAARHACANFSISPRTIKGHQYFYRQWTENGKRKQKIISKENLEADLGAFTRKKKIKSCYREAKATFQALESHERRLVRQKIRLLEALDKIPDRVHKNQYLDGSILDSKNELIISLLMDLFGVKYEHHNILGSPDEWMESDFGAENQDDKVQWEHAGMLGLKAYLARLCEKVKIYDGMGYRVGKNLIISRDYTYLDDKNVKRNYIRLPKIAWLMVSYDLVKPNRMLRYVQRH